MEGLRSIEGQLSCAHVSLAGKQLLPRPWIVMRRTTKL